MPGAQGASVARKLSASESRLPGEAPGASCRRGLGIWSIWLSTDHRHPQHGGLGCGKGSRVHDLARRGAEGTTEAAQAGQALARRWFLHSAAARIRESRVVV